MGSKDDTTEALPVRPSSPALHHRALIGRTLGKFTLIEELGRGGSGEVYRAEEAQLGRSVVVKVLRRDVTRPVAQVLRDVDCRVPLRVAGSRLEPRAVTCR